MKSAILIALILAGATATAFAQTVARLAEVAAFFAAAEIVAGPELVDCTLSQGERTECFSI